MPYNFISYYKIGDIIKSYSKEGGILNEILKRPSQDPKLKGISLRPELASLLLRPFTIEAAKALPGGESGARNRREAAGKGEDKYNIK